VAKLETQDVKAHNQNDSILQESSSISIRVSSFVTDKFHLCTKYRFKQQYSLETQRGHVL